MIKQEQYTKKKATLAMRIVMTFLSVLVVLFIFWNSSATGEVSSVRSEKVTQSVSGVLHNTDISEDTVETIIRKIGHVLEYMLLGTVLYFTLRCYTALPTGYVGWSMLVALCVAVADECYQLTVPGRSGLVSDVAIDFAGIVLGTILAICMSKFYNKLKCENTRKAS